jgi:hypothetical protein
MKFTAIIQREGDMYVSLCPELVRQSGLHRSEFEL